MAKKPTAQAILAELPDLTQPDWLDNLRTKHPNTAARIESVMTAWHADDPLAKRKLPRMSDIVRWVNAELIAGTGRGYSPNHMRRLVGEYATRR